MSPEVALDPQPDERVRIVAEIHVAVHHRAGWKQVGAAIGRRRRRVGCRHMLARLALLLGLGWQREEKCERTGGDKTLCAEIHGGTMLGSIRPSYSVSRGRAITSRCGKRHVGVNSRAAGGLQSRRGSAHPPAARETTW